MARAGCMPTYVTGWPLLACIALSGLAQGLPLPHAYIDLARSRDPSFVAQDPYNPAPPRPAPNTIMDLHRLRRSKTSYWRRINSSL